MKNISKVVSLMCMVALVLSMSLCYTFASDSNDMYPKTITFVKKSGAETAVTFNSESQELTNQGESYVSGWLTKSYFQGWSDKPSITDPDAKIWFPTTKIGEVVSKDGTRPTKLYAIYMDQDKSVKAIKADNKNNSIEINRKMDGEETLGNDAKILKEEGFNKTSSVDNEKTVNAKYEKGKDEYSLELQSRFSMDKSIALVTFLNTSAAAGGDNGARVLTNQYVSKKPGFKSRGPVFDSWFSKPDPTNDELGQPMTYVDLKVDLDERIKVPDTLTVTFKSYNFQPYYLLNGDKTKVLKNLNPDTVADSPVTAGSPETEITFPTEGGHSFVLRTGIKNKAFYYTDPNKDQSYWKYNFTTVNPNGGSYPVAPAEGKEKLATYLNAEEVQNIFNDVELNVKKGQLKISNDVAKDIADGKTKDIVVKGSIDVRAVVSTKAVTAASAFSAANLNIGFVNMKTVTFDENYKDKKADKTADVEKDKSINGDNYSGTGYDMVPEPTREGYVFKGWNTKADGSGKEFNGDSTVSDDITVYAIWEKVEKPKPGGGEVKPNPDNKPTPGENKPIPDTNNSPKPSKPVDKINKTVPDTSDDSNMFLYIMVLGLSASALSTLAVRKNKCK